MIDNFSFSVTAFLVVLGIFRFVCEAVHNPFCSRIGNAVISTLTWGRISFDLDRIRQSILASVIGLFSITVVAAASWALIKYLFDVS